MPEEAKDPVKSSSAATSLKATEVNEEVNYRVKYNKIHEIAVLL